MFFVSHILFNTRKPVQSLTEINLLEKNELTLASAHNYVNDPFFYYLSRMWQKENVYGVYTLSFL